MTDGDTTARTIAREIRAPRGAMVMHIDWADGHLGVLPHEVLRGFCPCAHCQGHQGAIRFVSGGNLLLAELEEVGNYAIRLEWADGHGTGLYAFRYLRELCSCASCDARPLEERRYGR